MKINQYYTWKIISGVYYPGNMSIQKYIEQLLKEEKKDDRS